MTDTEKKSKDLSHLHVGDNIKNMHLEAEGLEGLIVDLAREAIKHGAVIVMAKAFDSHQGRHHLQTFSDGYDTIADAGYKLYFLSSESAKKLNDMKESMGLPFDLLNDKSHKVARAVGALSKDGAKRAQIVIAKGGKVLLAELTTITDSYNHVVACLEEQ